MTLPLPHPTGVKAGIEIDSFAPRLSFFWGVGMNLYMVSIRRGGAWSIGEEPGSVGEGPGV